MSHDLTTRIPFAFARSALFRPGERAPDFCNADIAAANDYKITMNYSGPSLTPSHANAWQALIALAYKHNDGTTQPLVVRTIEVLRAMGRKSMQTNAKHWLHKILNDLTQAHVNTNTPRQFFCGMLLVAVEPLSNGHLRITFEHSLEQFLQDEIVRIKLPSKQGLTEHPIAAWLHDYIATHQSVYKVPVKTLHRLCGSTLTIRCFRIRLLEAMGKVMASGPLLKTFSIEEHVLTLCKQKTSVLLLNPAATVAKKTASWRQTRIQECRNMRIKVSL